MCAMECWVGATQLPKGSEGCMVCLILLFDLSWEVKSTKAFYSQNKGQTGFRWVLVLECT